MGWIIAASVIILVLAFTTFNLLRKNEKQEDILSGYLTYMDSLSKVITITKSRLEQIDEKGSFESDDEIGFFFEEVKSLQAILNKFILKEVKDDSQETEED